MNSLVLHVKKNVTTTAITFKDALLITVTRQNQADRVSSLSEEKDVGAITFSLDCPAIVHRTRFPAKF